MVDIESDGPIPGEFSMIAFAAVLVKPQTDIFFCAELKPVSEKFVPEALAVSGFTREECLGFDEPVEVMQNFTLWLEEFGGRRPIFISDNNGFDWMFICWYFHKFLAKNPFGYSSQNLGSLYKGLVKDSFQSFKHLRRTPHTHAPLDDARGNAEALLAMQKEYGLKISW